MPKNPNIKLGILQVDHEDFIISITAVNIPDILCSIKHERLYKWDDLIEREFEIYEVKLGE